MGMTEFMNLPPSSLKIYQILQTRKQMTFKEITSHTSYSTRTVRYALRDLNDAGLIGKIPDMTDLRRIYYTINR
ncbi:MAG: winged helix-turn-helix transcriptional regulator [Candidatus Heimdallarchaeota archaeon]|nr:MAG: winged helix-turn-helix transcriptional regulator [Candidatus Heimdallarchaeota archaeon]